MIPEPSIQGDISHEILDLIEIRSLNGCSAPITAISIVVSNRYSRGTGIRLIELVRKQIFYTLTIACIP
jgi:hypothetical protein